MTLEQMAMQGDLSPMLKSLIKGKYQYLTFLMSSAACMLFWLAPNQHRMQLIKPVTRIMRNSTAKMGQEYPKNPSKSSK